MADAFQELGSSAPLLEELRRSFEAEERSPDLSEVEWEEIDKDHEAHSRGEGKDHAWDEVNERLKKDIGQ